jgi:hypothetical protein
MTPLLALLLTGATGLSLPAEADLRYDNRGRPAIGVSVNDTGPYYMVIDTAAQMSLLSPALADQLHLPKIDSDLKINGATGQGRQSSMASIISPRLCSMKSRSAC